MIQDNIGSDQKVHFFLKEKMSRFSNKTVVPLLIFLNYKVRQDKNFRSFIFAYQAATASILLRRTALLEGGLMLPHGSGPLCFFRQRAP